MDCIHTQIHNKQRASLEFTRGFYVHFDQISRILSLVTQSPDRGRFYRAELAEATGLSEIQVGVQAKIAAAMGLLVPISYRLTNFGRLVSDYDLFFEDLGTLWVCHYALSSEPKRLLWNHVINCLLPTGYSYSAPDVRETLSFLAETHSARTLQRKVLKEVGSVFNAYIGQAFRQLHYLRETDEGNYALTDSPAPVPPGAFLAALLLYRDLFQPGASGLEVPTICTADQSPGRLLHLSEARVRALLNELHEANRLTIEAKANLDQVRFRPGQTWVDA
ncbi:MAG: DUF4007 family protein, partial [Chloroflexi bacterium]|nr:DUF4007 family protein [Chloroflexota bacterium]